jgi:lipopolysaccharide/colanic/teichoic acid biosynthesis glycosyltransferase
MPADCRRLALLVPDGEFRHKMKPGITGMAQAKGLHGAVGGAVSKDREVIVERYQWDAYYIRHAGFRMDMRILGKTVKLLLGWKG